MRQLGAVNVNASAPEIRDVLEKGVADAAGSPWGSMGLFGIDKVTKYHIDAPIYVSEQVWVLNKDKYEALSTAQKAVIDQHCSSEWALKIAAPWADFESGGRDKVKALAGHEVYPLTPSSLRRGASRPSRWSPNGKPRCASSGSIPRRSSTICARPWPNTRPRIEVAASMKRSTDRILTTHVGSLIRPKSLLDHAPDAARAGTEAVGRRHRGAATAGRHRRGQ